MSKNSISGNIYICNSISDWDRLKNLLNIEEDLVLTENFAIKYKVAQMSGKCKYYQQLLDSDQAQENNHNLQRFLENWNKDQKGDDLFNYNSVSYGLAFRIYIWTEIFDFTRLYSNLEKLLLLEFNRIVVFSSCENAIKILKLLNITFEKIESQPEISSEHFFFDNYKYMQMALSGNGYLRKSLNFITDRYSNLKNHLESLKPGHGSKIHVVCQVYHPTMPIIENLKRNKGIYLLTTSKVGKGLLSRHLNSNSIPIIKKQSKFLKLGEEIFNNYTLHRSAELRIESGSDISRYVYELIDSRIEPYLTKAIQIIESFERYLHKHSIDLEIQIANLGFFETLLSCVLKKHGVTSFIIQNGLQTHRYGDEGKHATHINAYGPSIASNYFEAKDNVYSLGDPRMDRYVRNPRKIAINRSTPVVGIGSSAFNAIDLNSYSAIEFEFLFDTLNLIVKEKVIPNYRSVKIKVRPNCVITDYRNFIDRYFPSLQLTLVQDQPMYDFLTNVDLYISFYSQTLFEASVLGIPSIYYKKDVEQHFPPFDGNSELVTANSITELRNAILDFSTNSKRFDAFISKEIMEQYVGNLRGSALEENLTFINELLTNHR